MLKISESLVLFLSTHIDFTDKMGIKIFPIVAPEKTNFPFTTYRINEQTALSKDGTAATIQLYFWFGPNEYSKCVTFTDAMKLIIEENDNYDWQNATVDFIEEGFSFVGIVNFNCSGFLESVYTATPVDPVVVCDVPVITPFKENQFTNSYFITKGIDNFLQIQATNNPTLYSYFISFLTDVSGISLNATTGLFTINYVGLEDLIRLNYTAENSCGPANASVYLRPVDTDVTVLLPPINLFADGFNSPGFGPSFMLQAEYLPYMAGTITKVEYWSNNVLHKTLQDSNLGNVLGSQASLMQGLAYQGTFEFKIRVGNSIGEYSQFSEVITVTIPAS